MPTASTSNGSSDASSGSSTTGRDATVEFREEHRRNVDEGHIVEVSLVIDGAPCAASGAARRTERRWTRSSTGSSAGPSSTSSGRAIGLGRGDGPASTADDAGRRRRPTIAPTTRRATNVVKVKRFAIEPMFEEDAVSRMEELGPRLLHLRERRERAAGRALPAPRRPVRPHRAGRRRRVHDRTRSAERQGHARRIDDRTDRLATADAARRWAYRCPVPMDHSPAGVSTGRSASRRGGSRAPPRDGHVDTTVVNGVA